MTRLPTRLRVVVMLAMLVFPAMTFGYGVIAILGVHQSTDQAISVSTDQFQTARVTSQLGRQIDAAYIDAQARQVAASDVRRQALDRRLFDDDIPGIDAALTAVQRLHGGDSGTEAADIRLLTSQWSAFRNLLGPVPASTATLPTADYQRRLDAGHDALNRHVDALVAREATDAAAADDRLRAQRDTATKIITGVVVLAVIAYAVIVVVGARETRRVLEPAQEQVIFAETLQLAGTEAEAHDLLRKYLQHRLPGASVTVLSRNNSADRLEAVTPVPDESALSASLRHAKPRSCLAIRSARIHKQVPSGEGLLACPVCSLCPGQSTCTPLTVGGEVIGSVLANRPRGYNTIEQDGLRDAVSQAAPVLANLRNLAIAELRASTDSLTGLPNKRSVADTLKRMLAQASRSLEPFSLVLLDLDHFKDINDTFGHPVGDQVLAGVGAAIQSALRDSDFAGRNGGEEFAILLPGTDGPGATETAEKIRAAIADIALPGLDVFVTTSAGIASFPDHATSAEQLEQLADSALYVAKRSGRNRVETATLPSRRDPADQTLA